MSSIIKTSISTTSDIYDMSGQWLPRGNYYFSIEGISNTKVQGVLCDRTLSAKYIFKPKTVIKMMSVAQARLARRANIRHEHMPSISSPVESQDYPVNFIVSTVTDPAPLPAINPPRRVTNSPERLICTICLDIIESVSSTRVLRCTHSFHAACINRWIRSRPHCPVCRTSVQRQTSIPNIRRPARRSHIPRVIHPVSSSRRQGRQREYNRIYAGSLPRLLG